MSDFHISTLAMSLYNVVAIGQAQTLDAARAALARHGMLVSLIELEEAKRELINRGFMTAEEDRVGVTGPANHVVSSRSREGDGWRDWMITPFKPTPSMRLEPSRIGAGGA